MWRERGGPAEPLERERALGGAIEQSNNSRIASALRPANFIQSGIAHSYG